MNQPDAFNTEQIATINTAIEMAEDLVSNYYKMSASQWLRPKYDIKTLIELSPDEIVSGPFAQIIRYKGQRDNTSLGSSTYDFYKICLQDHSIIGVLKQAQDIQLFPFSLYIVAHELIHIVRFSKFLQQFDASAEEKMIEESRVHQLTHDILNTVRIPDLAAVMTFYKKWRKAFDGHKDP